MNGEIDWILVALERDPTKSRAGIARALNIDKSAITRLLNGHRQLKFTEAEKIALYLGVTPAFKRSEGFGEPDQPFLTLEAQNSDTAPIYEANVLEDGIWLLQNTNPPIDFRPRAPHFQNATRVFGFYAPDPAMAPRFRSGEIVWVDPMRPPQADGDAMLVEKINSTQGQRILVATLTTFSPIDWQFIQYATNKEKQLPRSLWDGYFVFPRY